MESPAGSAAARGFCSPPPPAPLPGPRPVRWLWLCFGAISEHCAWVRVCGPNSSCVLTGLASPPGFPCICAGISPAFVSSPDLCRGLPLPTASPSGHLGRPGLRCPGRLPGQLTSQRPAPPSRGAQPPSNGGWPSTAVSGHLSGALPELQQDVLINTSPPTPPPRSHLPQPGPPPAPPLQSPPPSRVAGATAPPLDPGFPSSLSKSSSPEGCRSRLLQPLRRPLPLRSTSTALFWPRGLCTPPGTHRACSCLRAFAHAVCSPVCPFPPPSP